MKQSKRKWLYWVIAIVIIIIAVAVYFFETDSKPLHFTNPADGVAYYQKDFHYAMETGDNARALADIPLLQKFTRELYMAHPEGSAS